MRGILPDPFFLGGTAGGFFLSELFGLPSNGRWTSEMGTAQTTPHEKHVILSSSTGLEGNMNSMGVPQQVQQQPPVSGLREFICADR
jgi:hypothetical protein